MPLVELAELIRSVIGRGGHFELTATGDSMEPTIREGDVLLLGPARPGEPRPGQVVAVCGATLRVHRLRSCEAGWAVTRGDAHRVDDEPARADQILGVVRSARRPWRARLDQWSRRWRRRISAAAGDSRDRQ